MHTHGHIRGAISLTMTLVILVALSLVTLVGSRVALVEQRMAANNARANTAFAAAEAGVQAAQAYLVANRSLITATGSGGWMNSSSSVKWTDCGSSTAPPCGDGSDNLYGAGWQYYGPIPNLPSLPGEYQYQAWYLSNVLTAAPTQIPWIGCQQISLLSGGGSLPILNQVGALASSLITQVNGLVSQATSILNDVLNALIGQPNLLPENLGVPTELCLPINLTQLPSTPPPSQINPGLYTVAQASSSSDTAGAIARSRVILQRTSTFSHTPLSAIMVSGNANLMGDVRIWGNPRPPTSNPDFSTINLNNANLLGLNLTGLIDTTLAPLTTSLVPLVAPLLDPVLEDQLNHDALTLLNLNADVTFPLSIWSDGLVSLLPEPAMPAQVKTSLIGGIVGDLLDTLGLHGLVDDLINGIGDLLGGLLGGIFGGGNDPMVPNPAVLLNSARTCLPQWPGHASPPVTGAPRDACVPLSQTITVLQGMIEAGAPATPAHCERLILGICLKWVAGSPATNPTPPNNLSIALKLPDVQDNSATLQALVTGLLKPGTTPVFPADLMDYIFDVPASQATTVLKPQAQVAANCGGLGSSSVGMHWVTGDCTLAGNVGSPTAPVILIIQGDLTLAAGSTVHGLVYMYGGGDQAITSSAGDRATILGALLADGNLTIGSSSPINVVYDQGIIRAAGYLAGSFAPLAGSWTDAWSAP